jgi:hypothetical protein
VKPTLTAISGDPIATWLVPGGSLEAQVFVELDSDGHTIGSRPLYSVWFPPATVALNREVAEIFNGSTDVVRLRGIWLMPTQTAITGVQLGFDFNRITTVGSTSSVVRTARKLDKQFVHTLNASITCRDSATAGATLDWLYWAQYLYNEETSPGPHFIALINQIPVVGDRIIEIVLRQNEGLQVKISQLTGTAAGLVGCMMHFAVDN